MSVNNNETTTTFKADISNLKKGIQEAKRQIKLANSEFKAATAGMDNWSESADGITAKLKQLESVLSGQKKQLELIEEEYRKVAEEQGKNSKGAQELLVRINNQKAAIAKTESELSNYKEKLDDISKSSEKAKTAFSKLSGIIEKQEKDLDDLKNKYANSIIVSGEMSRESKELAKQIDILSRNLSENKNELSNAKSAADKLDNSLNHVEQSARDSEGGFTVMKSAIADLIADGFKSLASTAIDTMKTVTNETNKAYNSFQAATGTTTEKMGEFKEEIQDMYLDSFGENLGDIADKMAYVKQVTGEVDASKIRSLTENIITLEDTFGSDFNESLRGINNLMIHFGVDAETAFDLYAKGSQLGLDYTDELGDNIAEYGGNFKQAGYSADEYFQLLVNGTKNGAYNLDKVNDAINEVKNRIADGTIKENIKIYSKDTQKLFKNWESGKGTMKSVINSIVKDIKKSKNEQNALTMAATAFGTMGEDANLKVVKSLTSTGKAFKNVKGTMEEVKKVKYDDISTQITELSRTLETELFQPLIKEHLPDVKEFVTYAINNTDKVIDILKALGSVMATVFVVNKVAAFTQSLSTMATTFVTLKTSLEGATVAQKLLNVAQKASPAILVASAVGLLVNGMISYASSMDDAKDSASNLTKAEKENKNSIDSLAKSYREINSAKEESVADAQAEFGYYSKLKSELDGIVDKNGKVKKGYKDRAAFILNELNQALGKEIKMSGNIIENYQKEKKSLDKLIETKKAQIILNANEQAYTSAIKNQTKAFTEMSKAQENLTKTNQELAKAQELVIQYKKDIDNGKQGSYMYENLDNWYAAQDLVEELTKKQQEQTKTLEKATQVYVDYNSVIDNYEGLSSAIISGDTKKINDSLQSMINNFVTAENGTKESLEKQVKNMKKNYENLQKAIESGTPGVTKEAVRAAKEMVIKSEAELNKLENKAKKSGEKAGNAMVSGVESKKSEAEKAGKKISKSVKKGLDETNAESSGVNFVQGFVNGINKKANDGTVSGAVASLAKKTIKWLNINLDEHSPSRITYKSGAYFTEGFANGISDGVKNVTKVVTKMAKTAIKSSSTQSVGKILANGIVEGINKDKKNVKKSAEELSKIYVSTAKTKANALVKNNKLNLSEEIAYWKTIVKATKNGTNARKEAEKELAKAKKSYASECKKIDKEYLANVKSVNKQLKQDIQDVIDKYDEQVKSRKESILSELELFDAFESNTEYSAKSLIENLKSQVNALEEWDAALDKLENRKIIPQNLLEELQNMGVGSLANIKLFDDMTDDELEKYVRLWKKKNKLAQDRSEQENEALKKSTQKQIKQLVESANKQLTALEKEYNKKLKNIGKNSIDQSKSIGRNIVSGLKKGIDSETASFQKYLKKFFSSITSTAKNALKIHSPSAIMRDEVGRYISLGLAEGITKNKDAIIEAIQSIKSDLANPIQLDMDMAKQRIVNRTAAGTYGNVGNVTNTTNNYEFKQYNSSPKALSRLDIYRQTKNLHNLAKGV